MSAPDPWAVIEAVFPKATPNPPSRPAVVFGSADTAYAASALEQEAQRIVDAAVGTRNHALNRAAFSLGQLVAGGALAESDVVDILTHAARQAGLDDDEIEGTIASGLLGGQNTPRGVPEPPDVDGWLRGLPAASPEGVDPETGEVLAPDPTPAEALAAWHDRQVQRALLELRIKHEATLAHRAELAAQTFREPPSVFTLADELAIPDEPVTYAIEDLLPTGANALLAAQFKTGKTTFINNYARAFADGTPFLGRYNVNPAGGRVAIYNYEVSRDMFRRWMREMNVQNPDRIVVLNLRGFRLPLSAPPVEDWVVRWLAERDVTAWVVDPFARAAVGTDENSNTDVGVWLDTLDVIKERAGVRDLVLPTHTGRAEQEHGQERARGATRLDDWADVRWLLTKDDSDNRFFRATGRDVEVEEELLAYDPTDRSLSIGGGDRKWVKNRETTQRVLDFIAANPGCNTTQISASGGNKQANAAAAADLIRRHKVRTKDVRTGKTTAICHYANEESA